MRLFISNRIKTLAILLVISVICVPICSQEPESSPCVDDDCYCDAKEGNECEKDGKDKDKKISFLKKHKNHDEGGLELFELLDKNRDGSLDQKEFAFISNEDDQSIQEIVKCIYFLSGKLGEDGVNFEEFQRLRENGIKILEEDEWELFLNRLIHKSLVSIFYGEKLLGLFTSIDSDQTEMLSEEEQLNAANAIFGFPKATMLLDSISYGLEKLRSEKEYIELKFLDNLLHLRWTNSLIFYVLQAYYEVFYSKVLIDSDSNKDGYLTRGEINAVLVSSLGTDCFSDAFFPFFDVVSGDEITLVEPCSRDTIVLDEDFHFQSLEIKYPATEISNSLVEIDEEFYKRLDADYNGYVYLEELKKELHDDDDNKLNKKAEILFNEMDENVDTAVTIYEFQKFIEHSKQAFYDLNLENWQINMKEGTTRIGIATHVYQAFKVFDEDLNGRISLKEFRQTREIQRLYIRTFWIDALMRFLDKDGDGRITLEEFENLNSFRKFIPPNDSICREGKNVGIKDKAKELFEKIDASTDGFINKEEFYEMVRSISNLHPGELNQKIKNDYLVHDNEEFSILLCSSLWEEFIGEMVLEGNEKIEFVKLEKDFNKWDANGDKWINFAEYSLLYETDIDRRIDSSRFVSWLTKWLKGVPEDYTKEFLQDFKKQDGNDDGIISKGELIKILQNHRKDYYTDARVNAKFSRVDRNEDGFISMAEYYFLSIFKTKRQS